MLRHFAQFLTRMRLSRCFDADSMELIRRISKLLSSSSTGHHSECSLRCTVYCIWTMHRRSSPKLVRVSLWETVERVMASKELINRLFRGFLEEEASTGGWKKSAPRLVRSHFLSGTITYFFSFLVCLFEILCNCRLWIFAQFLQYFFS